MSTSHRRTKVSSLLLFVALAVVAVSAADPSPQAPTNQLLAAPPGSSSPDGGDGGSISAPAGGSDAASILKSQSHMMGGSQDSTDGDKDDDGDAKNPSDHKKGGKDGHNGQCVLACATKSTDGVGCGNDLSKPECFCKSESFIDQTFACINTTCPQQFHGAAGVITSICGVAGAPNLTIAGYNNSNNLENFPTINADDGANNSTNTTAPPSGSDNKPGVTSTFVMPASAPTGSAGGAKNNSQTGATGQPSGAAKEGVAGLALAITAAISVASFGIWTLV